MDAAYRGYSGKASSGTANYFIGTHVDDMLAIGVTEELDRVETRMDAYVDQENRKEC